VSNIEEVRDYVFRIDTNLIEVVPLQVHSRSNFGICRVKLSDQVDDLVIKWRNFRNKQLMLNEIESLERTADRYDTPRLVKNYGGSDFVAVLKTYMPGSTFEERYGGDSIPERYHKPVHKLVSEFHNIGISGLDPVLRNLIIYNEDITLFDFDVTAFEDKNLKLFETMRDFDQVKLERIF
jgi:hypothetical protein